MTKTTEGLEYNILGCPVRIKADEGDHINAENAINLVIQEIENLRKMKPSLRDVDLAVLTALKMSSAKLEVEAEYKENVFSLKSGITDALTFIEEVSPGSMQTNSL